MSTRKLVKCLPLLAVWPLLQAGCVADAVQFELLNLVSNTVFVSAQAILDNLINFNF